MEDWVLRARPINTAYQQLVLVAPPATRARARDLVDAHITHAEHLKDDKVDLANEASAQARKMTSAFTVHVQQEWAALETPTASRLVPAAWVVVVLGAVLSLAASLALFA